MMTIKLAFIFSFYRLPWFDRSRASIERISNAMSLITAHYSNTKIVHIYEPKPELIASNWGNMNYKFFSSSARGRWAVSKACSTNEQREKRSRGLCAVSFRENFATSWYRYGRLMSELGVGRRRKSFAVRDKILQSICADKIMNFFGNCSLSSHYRGWINKWIIEALKGECDKNASRRRESRNSCHSVTLEVFVYVCILNRASSFKKPWARKIALNRVSEPTVLNLSQ